jgi:hypothetical protein
MRFPNARNVVTLLGLALALALMIVEEGCGGSTNPQRSISVTDRLSSYSLTKMASCFDQLDISNAPASPSDYFPPLSRLAGLVGGIDIFPGSSSQIDGVRLLFERSPAVARANEATAWTDNIKLPRVGIGKAVPQIPNSVAPSLQSVRGNVIVFWAYPRKHVSSSERLLNRCLSRGRVKT